MGVKITFVRDKAKEPTVLVEALGFSGSSCEAATARIERALGLRESQVKKPEYHEDVVAVDEVVEGQG